MTNIQLWLAIGVPSILVVLSWMQQGSHLARLEARTDKGFEASDHKFDELRREMTALRDSIHRDMIALHERVAVVEAKSS